MFERIAVGIISGIAVALIMQKWREYQDGASASPAAMSDALGASEQAAELMA